MHLHLHECIYAYTYNVFYDAGTSSSALARGAERVETVLKIDLTWLTHAVAVCREAEATLLRLAPSYTRAHRNHMVRVTETERGSGRNEREREREIERERESQRGRGRERGGGGSSFSRHGGRQARASHWRS
eukprot:COSAG03_NODE_12767_length_531_cov_0.605081_1_plen_131_part_10